MIFRNDFIVDAVQGLKNLIQGRNRVYGGFAFFFFAVVRKNASEHLIEHEKTHIKQFWRNPIVYLWDLIFNRYKLELEAYQTSVKYGLGLDRAAIFLSYYNGGKIAAAKEDLINGTRN